MAFQNAAHADLPRFAPRTGHRIAGLSTPWLAVHRWQGSSGHVLQGLVHCQAMQPEWVRRVHEALKLPAQAPKAAQDAPLGVHQQLRLARCVWAYSAVCCTFPASAWIPAPACMEPPLVPSPDGRCVSCITGDSVFECPQAAFYSWSQAALANGCSSLPAGEGLPNSGRLLSSPSCIGP